MTGGGLYPPNVLYFFLTEAHFTKTNLITITPMRVYPLRELPQALLAFQDLPFTTLGSIGSLEAARFSMAAFLEEFWPAEHRCYLSGSRCLPVKGYLFTDHGGARLPCCSPTFSNHKMSSHKNPFSAFSFFSLAYIPYIKDSIQYFG